MIWSKHIEIEPSDFQLSYNDKIISLGSCFAAHVGQRLLYDKFSVQVNPVGVLYNPISIARWIEWSLKGKTWTEADLFVREDEVGSFAMQHLTHSFSAEDCLRDLTAVTDDMYRSVRSATVLMITFGTSYVYYLKETGQPVANCHKFPPSLFDRALLSVSEISDLYRSLTDQIRAVNPPIRILFSVSPIRHYKDGIHQNQISKSILHLAVDEILKSDPLCYYFPAYELMIDELRDYRWYDTDMIHPSSQAADYIYQRLTEWSMDRNTHQIRHKIASIQALLSHRIEHPSTRSARLFITHTLKKIEELHREYPFISFSSAVQHLESLLKEELHDGI